MTTRRDFIAASSLLALAPTAVAAAEAPTCPRPETLTWTFDRVRFNAVLAKPALHKQCFSATKLNSAGIITQIANSRFAYACYYPGETFQSIAVLYHGSAIALVMNDQIWNDILVPWLKTNSEMRKEIPEAVAHQGNPYMRSIYVPGSVATGTTFFVCHNAIAGIAESAADTLNQSPQKVHDAIMAGIIPGALVVPAGVMAINACQEAHFTYIQTSV